MFVTPDLRFETQFQAANDQSISMRYHGEERPVSTYNYLHQLALDSALGDIFIQTDKPFPKGSVLTINFQTDRHEAMVRGLVTHSRRWWGARGMQVSLFEIEGSNSALISCLKRFHKRHSRPTGKSGRHVVPRRPKNSCATWVKLQFHSAVERVAIGLRHVTQPSESPAVTPPFGNTPNC